MDSLRLEGTTIRGLVRGRPVNCVVRSVPDGLVLPPGQYVLRGENNPIYGQLISIESAFGPGGMEQVGIHFKMPAAALKDSPAFHFDKMPPAALKDSPAAIATLVPSKPASAPAALKYAPAAKFDAPAAKFDAPAAKFDGTSAKFDYVAGQGMSARVIIAIRPIGQNSLIAQAGFSDLVDAVQQAGGGVTLLVS